MTKIVRKLIPDDYWRVGEHESWFEYMASQGLHLKKVGRLFAKFIKGKPKQMRYRIDVSCYKKVTSEQKEMYSESGWNYVTRYGDFNVFSSPVELNSPELHTDPSEQSYTLKELDKQFISNVLIMVVGVSMQIWMMYDIYFKNSTYILGLVEGILVARMMLIALLLYIAYNSLKSAISIRTLRKTLSEGKPINHNSPWKKHPNLSFVIHIIFTLGLVIPPFLQFATSKTIPIQQAPKNLPIIRLDDIEQNSILAGKTHSYYDPTTIDESNIYYDYSFFAPIQYNFSESCSLPNDVKKYESGMYYSPSIDTWVYELRFPSMGKSLVSDLIKKSSIAYKEGSFTKIDNKDFDQLIIFQREDDFKEAFALKGKGVIHVRYYGCADNDSIIKNIAQKIDLISN